MVVLNEGWFLKRDAGVKVLHRNYEVGVHCTVFLFLRVPQVLQVPIEIGMSVHLSVRPQKCVAPAVTRVFKLQSSSLICILATRGNCALSDLDLEILVAPATSWVFELQSSNSMCLLPMRCRCQPAGFGDPMTFDLDVVTLTQQFLWPLLCSRYLSVS